MLKWKFMMLLGVLAMINVLRFTYLKLTSHINVAYPARESTRDVPGAQRTSWSSTCERHTARDYILIIKMPLNGRLGNFMFIYASTLGIAYCQNYTPTLVTTNNPLPGIFNITSKTIKDKSWSGWHKFTEAHAHAFDKRVLGLRTDKNQYLRGYYQSWKYFADPHIEQVIRSEFRFKEHVLNRALSFINNVTKRYDIRNGKRHADLRDTISDCNIL
jgi:hypothetical protein